MEHDTRANRSVFPCKLSLLSAATVRCLHHVSVGRENLVHVSSILTSPATKTRNFKDCYCTILRYVSPNGRIALNGRVMYPDITRTLGRDEGSNT